MNDFFEKNIPLNLYLSRNGIASRRRCAEMIEDGRVKVNGEILRRPGYRVETGDQIEADGQQVGTPAAEKVYILFNKPVGAECSRPGRFATCTVFDWVDLPGKRLFTVGRLDKNSQGLLLLTDDGEFSNLLTHPASQIPKVYQVQTHSPLSAADCRQMVEGIWDDNEFLSAVSVVPIQKGYRFTLTEGKKREIRRLVRRAGSSVLNLKRLSIGRLTLGDLPEGRWRYLSPDELKLIFES